MKTNKNTTPRGRGIHRSGVGVTRLKRSGKKYVSRRGNRAMKTNFQQTGLKVGRFVFLFYL